MKYIGIALAFVATLGTTACDNQTTGAVTGAVVGAAVGSTVGRGTGRVAATLVGAGLGAFVGSQIGRRLDERDRAYAAQNANQAMAEGNVGQPYQWRNPDSGNYGQVTPVSQPYQTSGRTCRDFTETVTLADGSTDTVKGRRCRNPDGSWEFVG
ncbi:MAG: RT0821/Lpp0805 family surface protein [Alphaproteobacteria bacterium]